MKELICLICKGKYPIEEYEDKDNPVCTECLQEHEEFDARELSRRENPYYEDE
jgi:hypothetical protein